MTTPVTAKNRLLIFDAHLDLAWNAIDWNRDLRLPVAKIRQMEIDAELQLMCARAVAERVRFFELIRLLKLRQKVWRAQPSQTSSSRRLWNTTACVDRKPRQATAV